MILYRKLYKMKTNLTQEAVKCAMNCNWQKALQLNLEILSEDTSNIDALNRLARCYLEIGELKKAKETAKKVLTIDPANSIAVKCLEKYSNFTQTTKDPKKISLQLNSFIEESGKTKIIDLVNLGDKKLTNSLTVGEEVYLITHTHKVSVVNSNKKYIGRIPDDVAVRIKLAIKNGNQFKTLIKSVDKDHCKIFIRETNSKNNFHTFPSEKIEYVSYTAPELVHKDIVTEDSLES